MGAAPRFTAQEQSRFPEKQNVLIERCSFKASKRKGCDFIGTGQPLTPSHTGHPCSVPTTKNIVKENPTHTEMRCSRGDRGENRKNNSDKSHVLK